MPQVRLTNVLSIWDQRCDGFGSGCWAHPAYGGIHAYSDMLYTRLMHNFVRVHAVFASGEKCARATCRPRQCRNPGGWQGHGAGGAVQCCPSGPGARARRHAAHAAGVGERATLYARVGLCAPRQECLGDLRSSPPCDLAPPSVLLKMAVCNACALHRADAAGRGTLAPMYLALNVANIVRPACFLMESPAHRPTLSSAAAADLQLGRRPGARRPALAGRTRRVGVPAGCCRAPPLGRSPRHPRPPRGWAPFPQRRHGAVAALQITSSRV